MSDKLEFIEQNKTNPDKSFDDLPGIIICLVQYKHSSIPCILGIGSYAYFCYNKKVTG